MDPITGAVVIAGLKYVGKPSAELVKDFLGKILAPTGEAVGTVIALPIVEWQKRRIERGRKLVDIRNETRTDALMTYLTLPSKQELEVRLANLQRLTLVTSWPEETNNSPTYVRLTDFGKAFVSACSPPE